MAARHCARLAGAAVVAIWTSASIGADTYPRQPGLDAEHYVFRLVIDDTKPDISGEATVRFRFAAAGVTSVGLDLASPAGDKGMTVGSVTMGTAAVPFTHTANRLTLTLPSAPAAGDRRQFTVKYAGVPANGLRLIKNKYGEWSAFSENWPNRAREWLPMIDHPSDKATSEFVITAPSKYQVVANGLLIEEVDLPGGQRLTHWRQGVPISSWLNAVGVAPFYVHYAGRVRGVELSTWVAPQDKDAGPIYFEGPARQALEFYSEFVGPYAYEKLANVAAAGIGGGTEHASAIFYGEKGVRAAPNTNLVAHEIAHQWFGNAVTERDWDDVWLSEGFATYFTHLFNEHYSGRDAMVAGLKRDITTVLNAERTSPDTPVVHRNLADMSRVLNRFVYQKGGWVLHMLRDRIGTEAFWRGIREYYRRYMNGSASTDDLRHVMEDVSGQDLRWFFAQWLNRPGVPRLEGSWQYDATNKRVIVTITQTVAGEPFRLPIDIGLVATAGAIPRIEKVELTAVTASFTISAETEPSSVELDPNTWLLCEKAAGPLPRRSGA
jgi:aminopeptidase N